jgi:hypothetical protein
VTQMVSAERAAALRDSLARFLAILSGRRRSAAAELGWIVVARGLVLEDRRKAWVHTLAGTNGDRSRFGVMHPCGVGRSTEGDQKAEGQNRTHRICSNRPTPVLMWCAGRTAAICTDPKIAQIGHAQQAGAAREHARPLANASVDAKVRKATADRSKRQGKLDVMDAGGPFAMDRNLLGVVTHRSAVGHG